MEDYYLVLGCARDASYGEIKKKYQELIRKCHPDKCKDKNEMDIIVVNEAWKTLSDPESRAKYNSNLLNSHCVTKPLLYATLHISELAWCGDEQVYCYDCRCGGTYTARKEMLSFGKVFINCDECSLCITVNTC